MKLFKPSKKVAIITGVIALSVGGATVAQLNNQKPAGATDSPLVTEVNNHEVRIGNAEKNIRDLQKNTGTPAASDTVTPSATSNAPLTDTTAGTSTSNSSPATTPVVDTPAAPTVVSYREIVLDADNSDCEYTYSDGSTYQFHWKTSNPKGAWVTDGNGNNGHWQATVNRSGYCDNRALGLPKAS